MRETQKYIKESLKDLFAPVVVDRLAWIIIEYISHMSYTQILAEDGCRLLPEEKEQARAIVDRLLQSEPIEYVLEKAFFHHLTFRVNRHTLIPRPETEELVELILSDYKNRKAPRLLDIGTGSGCIAVTLAKYLPEAEVVALDISAEALEVAKENARLLKVQNVSFVQADILSGADWKTLLGGCFDGIVSNPPYVLMEEKETMERNVFDYEPAGALFVPDDDPLLFYRAITALSRELLRPEARLYFEINARYGPELIAMIDRMAYSSVELIQDLSGKDRIIRAKR